MGALVDEAKALQKQIEANIANGEYNFANDQDMRLLDDRLTNLSLRVERLEKRLDGDSKAAASSL